jgi:hypothetical protein
MSCARSRLERSAYFAAPPTCRENDYVTTKCHVPNGSLAEGRVRSRRTSNASTRSVRRVIPSLANMWWRWFSTVRVEMTRCVAIAALGIPSAAHSGDLEFAHGQLWGAGEVQCGSARTRAARDASGLPGQRPRRRARSAQVARGCGRRRWLKLGRGARPPTPTRHPLRLPVLPVGQRRHRRDRVGRHRVVTAFRCRGIRSPGPVPCAALQLRRPPGGPEPLRRWHRRIAQRGTSRARSRRAP